MKRQGKKKAEKKSKKKSKQGRSLLLMAWGYELYKNKKEKRNKFKGVIQYPLN